MGILKHHLNMDSSGLALSGIHQKGTQPELQGVFVTSTHIYVSDTGHQRVVKYSVLGGGGGAVVVSCLQHVQGAGSSTGCETKGVLCCRILHV